MPNTAFIAVDLPAPLGPTMTAISPGSTPIVQLVEDVRAAVAARHGVAQQKRIVGRIGGQVCGGKRWRVAR